MRKMKKHGEWQKWFFFQISCFQLFISDFHAFSVNDLSTVAGALAKLD